MKLQTRYIVLGWLAFAALVGFFVSAPNFYFNIIGLDASAFALGPTIQSFFPDLSNAVGGVVIAFGALLLVLVAGFFVSSPAPRPAQAWPSGRRLPVRQACSLAWASAWGRTERVGFASPRASTPTSR
jgi:hypothetical protein